MSAFHVLDRTTPIRKNYILEASAGTGKTYAIENIVVRLLLDKEEPLALEQILLVTFTRAAVRDLKQRIRANLVACMAMLKGRRSTDEAHDYIAAILEKGPEAIKQAVKCLDEALFCYDRAQIFTIHAFCQRMLKEFLFEGGLGADALKAESDIPKEILRTAVVNHLQYGVNADETGKSKVLQAVGLFKSDINKLARQLENDAKGMYPILENGETGYATLARECQQQLEKITREEEILGFDSLLLAMRDAVRNPSFAGKVRCRYRAAIIDEFQDTDPIQWEIFKSLFVETPSDWGSLYLVGDPKQSIYSFRRADIYTYLDAAKALGEGSYATLDTNFRSTPGLIAALNALFQVPGERNLIRLPKLDTALEVPPVKAGRKDGGIRFKDNLGAIHFMAAERDVYSKDAFDKEFFAPAIAAEIQRLMREESVRAGQCAILVRDHFQATIMCEGLRKSGIAVVNQKQRHLSRSRMLHPVAELLESILAPRHLSGIKLALGGLIFGWDHNRVRQLGDLQFLETVLLRFHGWRHLLLQEGFPTFFEDLLHGPLPWQEGTVAEHLLSLRGGDDLYEELIQIGEYLAEEQSHLHLSADALPGLLKRMDQDDEDEESPHSLRPNRDADAVRVLTLHTSKGLEFDVVFAPGITTRMKENTKLFPKVVGGNPYMAFFDETDPGCQLHLQEVEAEQMRLLYVAATRAKYRLYLPVSFAKKEKRGTAPIELLMDAMGGIAGIEALEAYRRVHLGHVAISVSRLQPSPQPDPIHSHENVALQLPPEADFHFPPKRMLSYSGLSKSASKPSTVAQEKNPDELPSNSEVGNLLHLLLEELRFNAAAEEIDRFVDNRLRQGPYARWSKQIRTLVHNALNTPLPLKCGPTPLKALDPAKMFRETEFLFPWDQELLLPETTHISGYLKGVIDLVFEHEGLHYILDWKSNHLPGYGSDDLAKAMTENHYFLQAKVYEEAWRRYVAATTKTPFERVFGGVYYLFLRGLDPAQGPSQGVFHVN